MQSMRRRIRLSTLFLAASVAGAGVAGAQSVSAAVTMTATVTAAISASQGAPLAFGQVTAGGPPTLVGANSPSAGRINIIGVNNAGITMTMSQLPSSLTNGTGILGVSAYQYCYVQTTAAQTGCTPVATTQGVLVGGQLLSGGGQGFLFLGATLASPPPSQSIGAYSGNMQITVSTP